MLHFPTPFAAPEDIRANPDAMGRLYELDASINRARIAIRDP